MIVAVRAQGMLHNLEPLLVGFLKGALKALKRFTREHDDYGAIAQLTPRRQKRGSTTLINDENEGVLAAANEAKRRFPTQTEEQRNALYMVKMNHTHEWNDAVAEPHDQRDEIYVFSMRKARMELAEIWPKRRRLDYMKQRNAQIAENDDKAAKARIVQEEKTQKLRDIDLFLLTADDTAKPAALSELLAPALDEEVVKLRSIDEELIACKSSFKGTIDGVSPKN
jgi:hypothetical protein